MKINLFKHEWKNKNIYDLVIDVKLFKARNQFPLKKINKRKKIISHFIIFASSPATKRTDRTPAA